MKHIQKSIFSDSSTIDLATLSNLISDGGTALNTPLNTEPNIYTYPNTSGYTSISTAITNTNNMTKQVKVAVFTVERNDKNQTTSSRLVGEFWVEVKNGSSLDLAVAKQLKGDFDPANTVIKEIYSVTF